MFGCLRKLGCLVLLLVIGGGIYLYMHSSSGKPAASASASRAPAWEAVSPVNAQRGGRAVESLSTTQGPVFANLSAGEAASYIFLTAARQLPPGAEHATASVQGDQLLVRSEVPLAALGAKNLLGPLASLLGDRDTLLLGGRIAVLQPGLGEFQVTQLKIGKLTVPAQLIPRLLDRIRKGPRPAGVAENALAMPMPDYIADVRIANGHITIYKNPPSPSAPPTRTR